MTRLSIIKAGLVLAAALAAPAVTAQLPPGAPVPPGAPFTPPVDPARAFLFAHMTKEHSAPSITR